MSSRFRTMRRAGAVAVGLMLFSLSPAQADETGALGSIEEAVDDVIGDVWINDDLGNVPPVTDTVEVVVDAVSKAVDTVGGGGCDPNAPGPNCGCAGALCPLECLSPQGVIEFIQRGAGEGWGQVSCGIDG